MGYLVLRGFFERATIAAARDALEQLVDELIAQYARRGEITATFPAEPFETRLGARVRRADGGRADTVATRTAPGRAVSPVLRCGAA